MTEADTTHVSPEEADDAQALLIGAGTAETAPPLVPKVGLLDGQPTAVIGGLVTAATAILATPGIPLPEWLKFALALVIAVAGLFGIYSKVTPVAKPRLDGHTPLTP